MEIGSVVAVKVLGGDVPMAMEESGAEDLEMASVHNLIAFGDSVKGRAEQLLQQLNLQFDHLTQSQKEQLEKFLLSYQDVFALDSSELGTTRVVSHSINTGDHIPIKQPVRRIPFALRSKVDELVTVMLAQGVIVPSKSPWASPIVLVRKKDGHMRFCVDYRKFNQVTKLDEFPLPRIDDTLELLAGARHFTTLDMASVYWQVEMEPESHEKTAFATYSGLFEFQRMPFGLANTPATFQRLMEVVLASLARNICVVYLDDVLVVEKTLEEHNQKLTKVLERFRKAGLRLKVKKCHFAQAEVEYLGHIVSVDGIRTNPKKLEAMSQYHIPTNLQALRSFLGLASYYRRFVPRFSRVAAPLHGLTRKDAPFVWTREYQIAFEELKHLITSSTVLAYPDFGRPFIWSWPGSCACPTSK